MKGKLILKNPATWIGTDEEPEVEIMAHSWGMVFRQDEEGKE